MENMENMENITIYIKQLSGDIIPINFKPDVYIRNVNLLFKVHSLFPEYPLERILLFHNDFIDLSKIKDQDILNLFICDSYQEKIIYSLVCENYERYTVNIYDNSSNYFYNKERKSSICFYIFMRLKNKYFKVSTEENYDENDENDENDWFPDLYHALVHFQKDYNNIKKHTSFTDEKVIYIYHLWNIKKIN